MAALLSMYPLKNLAFSARPSLCAPSALRGASGDATMSIPGGAGTTPRTVFDNSFLLGATGFSQGRSFVSELALTLRSAPSR